MCNRFILTIANVLILILFISRANAQNTSNEGTEFYAVFPSHVNAPDRNPTTGVITRLNLAEYSIFITGKQASSGLVSVNGSNIPFVLSQGNTVVEVKVPREAAYINQNEQRQVLSNRAIKITVDPGKPKVVVYGHIFAGRRSAASLILPKDALGQEYFSMNRQVGLTGDGGFNHIVLAGVDADTRIFIRSKEGTDLVPGGVLLKNPGDVYEYLSQDDLTGTKVFVDPATSACKKFALFSGTTNSSVTPPGVPCNSPGSIAPSSDPLYQQNYPVESWGRNYGFVPFSSLSASGSATRTNGNYFRVLAKEDNTVVTYNGNAVATLAAGIFYEISVPSTAGGFITADKPVAVAQYALSQACAGGNGFSDADMVILNPIEYNIKNITVYSSPKENIQEQYINILIKTSAALSFRINGAAPAQRFTPLPSAAEYSYLQLSLNSYRTNSFSLSADEGFNAIAYGFGNAESYAYSAGTNLASSQSVAVENPDTKDVISDACSKEPFRVKVTLTSPVLNLSWQFEENGPFVDQQVTAADTSVIRNGTTYYDYYFPQTRTYDTAGQKTIRVIARYPSTGGCALSEQQIDLLFRVYDPPVAKFKSTTNFCALSAIEFTDESIDNGNAITKWYWDFGDGKTSEEKNPAHAYKSPGTYTIKLLVENSTSCNTLEYTQDVVISSVPLADFSVTKPDCDNTTAVFRDNSAIETGNIVKWQWDFGDGKTIERTDNLPVEHEYTAGGDFSISLVVTSDTGCQDTLTKTVNVSRPFLEMGPDVVMIRGGAVTLNVTATGNNLRYKWSPSAGLDRDDVRNPIASPSQETLYSLTITSEEGCVLTDDILVTIVEKPVIRNTFTPNGDGVNDVWEIDYLDTYPEVRVDIFNRFGVKIYASTGYARPWDGTTNGSQLPVGTYYYVIDPKMGLPPYTGWVTILR